MLGFSPMICTFQGWAQGGLGMAVLGAGLVFAIGLMVYLRWSGAIPYVIGGALAMYYGVPIIESMFHWDQDCAVVRAQFAQQEHYAANTRVCENNLFNTDEQTGEDCSCNGRSATPQCQTYYSSCEGNLQGYATSSNTCSCSFSTQVQDATPICSSIPNNAKPAYSATCTQSSWNSSAEACQDPIYFENDKSKWIGPTVGFSKGNINGAAFYTYQTKIDNPTGKPKTVYWFAESDNQGWYDLNGVQVGYGNNSDKVQQIPIVLQPGENTLSVTVHNFPQSSSAQEEYGPNPSGTIDQVEGSNKTVYSTTGGKSWYQVQTVSPSSLSPPPSGPIVNCYTQSCAG
ncbi:hypothetical protein H7F10_04330 [Acidithiobacillus sp. HP-6]|uniref:hypothetical protein n=1 Tax=unclassified Acidithiobacillus TaxID=2614800 RepID=UPI00187AE30D|nr:MULTISPECIES: hypothetical protein [unclassified Acidithiobacillus]MBE7562197.1 hypothetical protein [Acidithiobacillus sp. HP-6]MBE7568922.1 hypothetical protein [Acidithiobacillus sp. HP-2]